MSTILSTSSQAAPLSARRRWCWAKTDPLQASSDNKQVGVLSIAWMTKEPYSAYHEYLPKWSMLSLPHTTQRRLLRRRSGKGKRQHLWIPRRALVFPPPGSHCHLLEEAQEQAPMPHSTPQPFSVSGHLFPCVHPALQAGLMDLLMRPSVTVFSSFLLSNAGLG